MRIPVIGVALVLFCAGASGAQDRDRQLERVALALQQPSPIVLDGRRLEGEFPRKLGIFTQVQPQLRGEFVRISVPIGDFVTRAFDGIASAHRRRQEAAARRTVEAERKRLAMPRE